jgi:hypothetical protein
MPDNLYESRRALLSNRDAMASPLVVLAMDCYGSRCLNWDPQTLLSSLRADFKVHIPTVVFDRLMAGATVLTTDAFYTEPVEFNHICVAMAGEPFNPDLFQPASAADCAWGLTEAMLLSPPESDEPFTDEVRIYLAQILKSEGIISPPKLLRLALHDQNLASQVSTDFGDDVVMTEAIWSAEEGKTKEIDQFVNDRMHLLARQLSSLVLANGETKEVIKQILSAAGGLINEEAPKSSPIG